MDVCKRRRRDGPTANHTPGIAAIQDVLNESVLSLPSYTTLRLCQHYYEEFTNDNLALASMTAAKPKTYTPSSVSGVNFAFDLAVFYLLIKRSEALRDAHAIVVATSRLFQAPTAASGTNDVMVPPQYRCLCPERPVKATAELLNADDSVPGYIGILRTLVRWLSIRRLRKALEKEDSEHPLSPNTIADLVGASYSRLARSDKGQTATIFRKDALMASKRGGSDPFHLDWLGRADLAHSMKTADESAIREFFTQCYKYSMITYLSKPEPSGAITSPLHEFLKDSGNYWLDVLTSALTKRTNADPVVEVLLQGLPTSLKSTSMIFTAPGKQLIDGDSLLLPPSSPSSERQAFLQVAEEVVATTPEHLMSVEERAFWSLHCGRFAESVLATDSWEAVLLCWMTALLIQTSLAEQSSGACHRPSVSFTTMEPSFEIARKAAPALQKRLNEPRRDSEQLVVDAIRAVEESCSGFEQEQDEIRLLLCLMPFFRVDLDAVSFSSALSSLVATISGARASAQPLVGLALCEAASFIMRTEWSTNEARRSSVIEGSAYEDLWYSDDTGCVMTANQLGLLTISNLVQVRESQLDIATSVNSAAFVVRVLELADEKTQAECLGMYLTSEIKVASRLDLEGTLDSGSDLFMLIQLLEAADSTSAFNLLFAGACLAVRNLQTKLLEKTDSLRSFSEGKLPPGTDEECSSSSIPTHEQMIDLGNEMRVLQLFIARLARITKGEETSLENLLSVSVLLANAQQYLDAYYFQRLRSEDACGRPTSSTQLNQALWGISSRYSEDVAPDGSETVRSSDVAEERRTSPSADMSTVAWTSVDDHTTVAKAVRLRCSQPKARLIASPESVWASETFHEIVVPLINSYCTGAGEVDSLVPLGPIWKKRECKLKAVLADDDAKTEVDGWHDWTAHTWAKGNADTRTLALHQYFSLFYRSTIMSAVSNLGVELCRTQTEAGLRRCESWLAKIESWTNQYLAALVPQYGFPLPDSEEASYDMSLTRPIRAAAWRCFHTDINSAIFKFARILVADNGSGVDTLPVCVNLADVFGALLNPRWTEIDTSFGQAEFPMEDEGEGDADSVSIGGLV